MNLLALPDDILDSFAQLLLQPYSDSHGCVSILDAIHQILPYATFHPRLLESLDDVHLDLDRGAAIPRYVASHVRKLSLSGAGDTQLQSQLLLLLPDVRALEALDVNNLDAVPDAAWEVFMRANGATLRALTLSASLSPWKNSSTLCHVRNLRSLTIKNCPNIRHDSFAALIASNARSLRNLSVSFDAYGYNGCGVIAAYCRHLESLELGRNMCCVPTIIAAVTASRGTLNALVLHARRPNGASILSFDNVAAHRLLELRTLDIGGGVIPIDVALQQRRKIYISPADSDALDIKAYVRARISHLDLCGLANTTSFTWLFTPYLRTLKLAAMDRIDLHYVARNTGHLTHITLQDMPNISIDDIHALLRNNKRVESFAIIGPKCRRLSNVAVINALATHANSKLRVATFPRWSVARTPKNAPHCLTQAIERFRRTAPMAVIRAE